MNDIQVYHEPDWERIAHLFKLGIAASLVALIGGDMLRLSDWQALIRRMSI